MMIDIKSRLSRAGILILIVFIVGTMGFYLLLDEMSLLDSFYLTVITLTTVGYGDFSPHSNMGDGNAVLIKWFAIILILVGMSLFLYTIGIVTEYFFSGELGGRNRRRRMLRHITQLNSHYIICGAGKTGRYIIDELTKTRRPFVVIEADESRLLELKEDYDDMLYIQGDATDDRNLVQAGLDRASGIAAALKDEKDNLYIVLAMHRRKREAGDRFRIVAKVTDHERTAPKLFSAGADAVISPPEISGKRMMAEMLRPSLTTFLDKMLRDNDQVMRVEQATICGQSPLIGAPLQHESVREKTGVSILALKQKGSNRMIVNPDDDQVLEENDVLICLGDIGSVEQLRKLCRSVDYR